MVAQWCSDTWKRYSVRFPDDVTSVDEEVDRSAGLTVFPNPATSHVTVVVDEPTDVQILDLTGRVVFNATVQVSTSIDLSTLSPGMYYVRSAAGATTKLSVW